MWDISRHVLAIGGDVVLDYGCWARAERDEYGNRAARLRASFQMRFSDVPPAELYRRLEKRNANVPDGSFRIPRVEMDRYVTLLKRATADEFE